jgi:hypothetical protein
MGKAALIKQKVFWIGFSILFSNAYSQSPGDKFMNKDCEYIHFLNDSLIEFMLTGNYQGSIETMYHGTGRYKITNNQLTVYVDDYNIDSLIERKHPGTSCLNFKERISGVDKYKIVITASEAINLIGPIIDDYQKLNKRRFIKSFLNWPWKWSFKKQHWYDPRERKLYKSK